jgi:hypothetical protein
VIPSHPIPSHPIPSHPIPVAATLRRRVAARRVRRLRCRRRHASVRENHQKLSERTRGDSQAGLLWGSITGSGPGGLAGWDHRGVIISVLYLLVRCLLGLWVPTISSTSCDQAIIVDRATDASLSSYAVLPESDRLR